uniref:8.9 kDa family member n=1 Tax=Rhipicephalus zambeziensis TaxID=60191 RepID=A0A224Y1C1_9ACAR
MGRHDEGQCFQRRTWVHRCTASGQDTCVGVTETCIVSSDLNMTEGESIEKNIFCRRTTCEASKGFLKEEHCTVPKNYTLSKMHIEPKGGEFPYCCPWFSARRK